MRQLIRRYTGIAVLMLVALPLGSAWADDSVNNALLKGDYAFTLAESCIEQFHCSGGTLAPDCLPGLVPGPPTPMFVGNPAELTAGSAVLNDGAFTYNGGSSGIASFDGKGGFAIRDGLATNMFPAFASPGANPFFLGPVIPFACSGSYTVDRNRNVATNEDTTCSIPNVAHSEATFLQVFDGSRVDSNPFILAGIVPSDSNHLTLTGIGGTVETFLITFPSHETLATQRVCTRAVTLNKIH